MNAAIIIIFIILIAIVAIAVIFFPMWAIYTIAKSLKEISIRLAKLNAIIASQYQDEE